MTDFDPPGLGRRAVLGGMASILASPALSQATPGSTEFETPVEQGARRNISSFRALDWRPYFTDTQNGAILVDLTSRVLHFWSADRSIYRLYPTSVPMSEDLTRHGRTEITRKVEGPSWSPTPAMRQHNPEWPDFVPPGPDNPLGTHALHLSWQYYRIHGTHDTRKIGRRSSNGCVGLYNHHIGELYTLTRIGTQVLLI